MLKKISFAEKEEADALLRILSAALDAANPSTAIRRRLTREKNLLAINEQRYALKNYSAVYLAAIGKAAIPMAHATAEILGADLDAGVVVYKTDPKNAAKKENLRYFQAAHPIPDGRSLAAGEYLLEFLSQATSQDLVLFLISGGGSALITLPEKGITLGELQSLTDLLLRSGVRIDEMNTLRRALDRVKGGGLAEAAAPAETLTLLLSDVVNSPLEAIASGPTVPNPTDKAAALAVLEKYHLCEKVPPSILDFLREREVPRSAPPQGFALVIGDNRISAAAAKSQAEKEGFFSQVLTTSLQGEAAEIGAKLGRMLRENDFSTYGVKASPPYCLILGGETTVTLQGKVGRGGRNQELALAAAVELDGAEDVILLTLATDGEDGPTDAAGAIVAGETLVRAKALGLDAATHLRRHDAYPFFDSLGDLLKIGSTGTNVNDLIFCLAM